MHRPERRKTAEGIGAILITRRFRCSNPPIRRNTLTLLRPHGVALGASTRHGNG